MGQSRLPLAGSRLCDPGWVYPARGPNPPRGVRPPPPYLVGVWHHLVRMPQCRGLVSRRARALFRGRAAWLFAERPSHSVNRTGFWPVADLPPGGSECFPSPIYTSSSCESVTPKGLFHMLVAPSEANIKGLI